MLDLTRASGAAERYPAWSPDGKSVAYWSDRSGEYELTCAPADGTGSERKVTTLGPGFRYRLFWSPDCKKVAFIDKAHADPALRRRERARDARSTRRCYFFEGDLRGFRAELVGGQPLARLRARPRQRPDGAIFLYDTKAAALHQVTSGFYNDALPVFDPDGKYLFFLTNRTFEPIYSDLDDTWIYANTTLVAAVPLRKDVPSPLAPRNDDEGKDEREGQGQGEGRREGQGRESGRGREGREEGRGEAEGAAEAGRDRPRRASRSASWCCRRRPATTTAWPRSRASCSTAAPRARVSPRTRRARSCSTTSRSARRRRCSTTSTASSSSADGEKLLVWKKEDYAIVEPKDDQKLEKKLATERARADDRPARRVAADLRRRLALRARLLLRPGHARRGLERDAPALRQAARRRRHALGRQLRDRRADRRAELVAHLPRRRRRRGRAEARRRHAGRRLRARERRLSHQAHPARRALGHARCARRSTRPASTSRRATTCWRSTACRSTSPRTRGPRSRAWRSKTVLLTVNDKPTLAGRARGARQDPRQTRTACATWPGSRRTAARWTKRPKGRVGYVYVPDTGPRRPERAGAPVHRPVPEGGPDHRRALQQRRPDPGPLRRAAQPAALNYWAVRDGRDWQWPPVAHFGPEVMLINGWSGSGGDAFPFYFKQAGLGPLIGTRTWGGLIGISGVAGPGRRRRRHRADVRHLQHRRPVDRRGPRRRSGHRGGGRPGADAGRRRSAARARRSRRC